jgi:hypothetical protein
MHDPTEIAIQKMIEASQRLLKGNSQGEDLCALVFQTVTLAIQALALTHTNPRRNYWIKQT